MTTSLPISSVISVTLCSPLPTDSTREVCQHESVAGVAREGSYSIPYVSCLLRT